MPKGCCGADNCACKIAASPPLTVTGSGQPGDPFTFAADIGIVGSDNTTFNTDVSGGGSSGDPYLIEVNYNTTARLDDVPDVNAPGPTNGQVLAWDSASNKWIAAAPTTAAAGAVQHNGTLVGDGSVGVPLSVVPVDSRLLGAFSNGVGLSDQGLLSVVQHFPDAASRLAAIGAPGANMLTMLDSVPGVIDYWDGTEWTPLESQTQLEIDGGEFLALSGSYAAPAPVTVYSTQVTATTDTNGAFDVLDPTALTGRAGVLTVQLQEVGSLSGVTPWKAMIYPNTDRVSAHAYRLDSGAPYAGVPVVVTVQALLY